MSTIEKIVSGGGKYVDDVVLPDMVHIAFYRSTYARARIRNIKADYTYRNIHGGVAAVGEGAEGQENADLSEPVLAKDTVLYVGQPIAVMVGSSKYEAEDKLESVEVDYEPLKPVMDPEAALTSEPIIPGTKTNIIADRHLGEEFDIDADIVLEDRFFNQRIATNPIETRGIVADYDGDRLTVYISTQAAHSIKEGLVDSLSISPDKVRVIQVDTGGAFGLKGGLYPEYVVAAEISMKLKKPVKWIESRSEHLVASHPGRGVVGKMTLYARKDGRVLGVRGEVITDAGAYDGGMGGFSSAFIARMIPGPYDIKNAYIRAISVMTDKASQGPYRGAGRPEAAFFMERMMDLLAQKLSMDPVKLRLMNMSDKPLTSPTGQAIEAARPFYETAVKELEYEKFKGRKPGVAFFVLVPAMFSGESCRVNVDHGKVKVWLGGNNHGQRHDLFVKQIVSEELSVSGNAVELQLGDTDALKEGVGSWGSRTAIVGANALITACRKLKDDLVKQNGKYDPSLLDDITIDSEVLENPGGSLNSFGANLATVEIDELGHIHVTESIACYDIGHALNKGVVISQIEGGSAQGLGQVLSERIMYSDDGQLITSSISEAGLLDSTRVPNFKSRIVEIPSHLPHGAKGVGESPTIGVPAAVVSAIDRLTGIRIRDTPVGPELFIEHGNENE